VAVFILGGCYRVGQHLFTSGVVIGRCLLNPLVIGCFQKLPEPSGARCLGFHLLFRHRFLGRVRCYQILAPGLVTSADVVTGVT